MVDEALTPAQRAVLAQLRDGERPVFAEDLAADLHAQLTAELAPHARVIGDGDALWVGKRQLALVHACEAHYVIDGEQAFAWSIATAKGTLAHRAIELSAFARALRHPGELVEEAVASLIDAGTSLGDFLAELAEADRALLEGEANALVAMFLDGFPPLRRQWRPVVEGRLRVELFDRRIVLAGKPDLMLGRATGTQAGRVIIDVKGGGFSPSHRDDVRFYALLDALRHGVPPFRAGTYYLESGDLIADDIDEALLRAQIRRVVDGVDKMLALREEAREPARTPGPICAWCPEAGTCQVA